MDKRTAARLSDLNRRFYSENAASFSATRHGSWPGWETLARIIAQDAPGAPASLDVLDVACGNMRFADFLDAAFPRTSIRYQGIDSCDDLVPPERAESFCHVDIMQELLAGKRDWPVDAKGTREIRHAGPFSLRETRSHAHDLVVCFGFMHHIPGIANREELLRALVSHARPGGIVALSFWRFMASERLARKAEATTERALAETPELQGHLDEGDFLLGWQGSAECLRYCHSFSAGEVDSLAGAASDIAAPLARYRADGHTAALNEYLLLRRL